MNNLQHIPHFIVDCHIHTQPQQCTVGHVHIAIPLHGDDSVNTVALYECYMFNDTPVLDCVPDTVIADTVRLAQMMVNYCLIDKGVRIL